MFTALKRNLFFTFPLALSCRRTFECVRFCDIVRLTCPLTQFTDSKCVGQQKVHCQEPAGDGSGFWSKPHGANKEKQRKYLLWFGCSFPGVLFILLLLFFYFAHVVPLKRRNTVKQTLIERYLGVSCPDKDAEQHHQKSVSQSSDGCNDPLLCVLAKRPVVLNYALVCKINLLFK